MSDSFPAVASKRLLSGLLSSLTSFALNTGVLVWDLSLTFYNLFAPLLPENSVVPEGCPGAHGVWPEYVPPTSADSRCSCPALNAMANHGILPHSGRGISFRALTAACRTTYNTSSSFSFFVPFFAANMLNRNYWADSFDLRDIDVHNGIEHDASLIREDTFHVPNQGPPCPALIRALLASATGPGGVLTTDDLARVSAARRAHCRRTNGQFSLNTFHRLFGSTNSATLLTIFGGRVDDLAVVLLEERLPPGWQSRVRHPAGLTFTQFQPTILRIELAIQEGSAPEGTDKRA
ncbi:uncharacterized protein FIBRA_08923 [Fibroporia radiculosa]|uniref:Heme haloperoxidase family profile domain-containing protein n=1 Tax=Fibroporia radiculosa TaxID=599839 RepID=J4ICL9_9APHY|nr:uncharacterized protein FIBRA_08923 [Fibroporia radiculosa]CCM06641.1 predicted protein [Fibroporia radiculosa]